MKQTVRYNVFETNSSSNHTIVITDTAVLPELSSFKLSIVIDDEFDEISQHGADVKLTTPREKLTYLWTYIAGNCPKTKSKCDDPECWTETEERVRRIKELFPNCKFSIKYDKYGYPANSVNHQSLDSITVERIFSDPELLRWFMSDATTIYLTSDEGDGYGDILGATFERDIAQHLYIMGDSWRIIGDPEYQDMQGSDDHCEFRRSLGFKSRWS